MLLNLMVLVVGGVVYGQETGQRVGSGLGEGQGAQIAAGQVSVPPHAKHHRKPT